MPYRRGRRRGDERLHKPVPGIDPAGLTPRDAAIVYMHELHDRYMRRKPGVYDCCRPESERENGCAGCNLRKLLGQPAGFGGGCCGWALYGAPAEVAIEILETALAVEEEKYGKTY